MCWSWWVWIPRRPATPTSCPAVSSSVLPSPAPWSTTPSTIIADEPTGNLDPARSLEIMTLLQEINNLGTTMLVVTHEQNLVEQFTNRVITIDEGLISSDRTEGQNEDQ